MVPACCDAGTVVITWDTGLQLGLVLPSPALEGVGWPGLWGKQEPGAHVSPAGVVGAPGSGRLVRVWGRLSRVETWQSQEGMSVGSLCEEAIN